MTRKRFGIALVVLGVVLLLAGLGLAFTIYGDAALVLAAVAIACGVAVISRPSPSA